MDCRDDAGLHAGEAVVHLAGSGDVVIGVLIGVPYPYAPGGRGPLRIAINLYSPEDGAMRVLMGEPPWLLRVLALRREHRLADWILRFEHRGQAGLVVSRVRQLSTEEAALAAACPPHDLPRLLKGPQALPLPRQPRQGSSRNRASQVG